MILYLNHIIIGYTIALMKIHKILHLKFMMSNHGSNTFYNTPQDHYTSLVEMTCKEKITHKTKHHMKTKTIHKDTRHNICV